MKFGADLGVHEPMGVETKPLGELRTPLMGLIGDLDHGITDRQFRIFRLTPH